MPSLDLARAFVYERGAAWERALFGHLLDGRPAEEPLRFLRAYKNSDGGFGHGLEHDVRAPVSNVPALEFLLSVARTTGLDVRPLLDGTPAWLAARRRPDGSLADDPALLDHPLAPWWRSWEGQPAPDAVTGHLVRLGLAPDDLRASTRAWAAEHLTVEAIGATEWLFMLYHPIDYLMNERDLPDLDRLREATAERLVALAEAAPEAQYGVLLSFLGYPYLAERVPRRLVERDLDHLAATQRDDGGWRDEHGLAAWWPYTTLCNALFLRRHGRL